MVRVSDGLVLFTVSNCCQMFEALVAESVAVPTLPAAPSTPPPPEPASWRSTCVVS
jgi:hypothetical protein